MSETGDERADQGTGDDIPNKTLAATQELQINNGLDVFWNPTSLALLVKSTMALVAFRHVEV